MQYSDYQISATLSILPSESRPCRMISRSLLKRPPALAGKRRGKQAGSPTIVIINSELVALRISIMQGEVDAALPEFETRLAQVSHSTRTARTGFLRLLYKNKWIGSFSPRFTPHQHCPVAPKRQMAGKPGSNQFDGNQFTLGVGIKYGGCNHAGHPEQGFGRQHHGQQFPCLGIER